MRMCNWGNMRHRFIGDRKISLLLFGLVILLMVGTYPTAWAKSGNISGHVIDKETGEPVIGASIQIMGTQMGGMADLDGNFMVQRIPGGTYTVMVSAVGYSKVEVSEVAVQPDNSTRLEITLEPQAMEGKKITVTARALENTEANLLRQRQKSVTISDAISAEAISRSGSGDAADALERVTGASVVDGSFVVVRGLGGRYGNAKINGSVIPTPDPDGRAVPMDLFPTSMLDNITVEKTFSPDKPGNFSGGSVDLNTKSLPEELTLSFSTSVKYNPESNLRDDFLAAPRSSTDWMGFDDGMREIPELLDSDQNIGVSPGEAQYNPEAAYRLDTLASQLKSTWEPKSRPSPLNQSYSFTFGNNYLLLDRPLGVLASLSYSTDYSFYNDGHISRYSRPGAGGTALTAETDLTDIRGKEEVLWGGLVSASYPLHPNHKFTGQFVYNRQGSQSARYLTGEVNESGFTGNRRFETRTIEYVEQSVRSFQLRGEHFLAPFRVDWNGAVTRSDRSEPDVRDFSNDYAINETINEYGDTTYDTTYGISTNQYDSPSHYFRDVEENNDEVNGKVSFPLGRLNGREIKFTTGLSYLENKRDFSQLRIQYNENPGLLFGWDGDADYFYSDEYNGIVDSTITIQVRDTVYFIDVPPYYVLDTLGFDTFRNYNIGAYIIRNDQAGSTFSGEQKVFAWFGMTELDLLPKLKFVGGARYEVTDMSITSAFFETDTTGPRADLINVKDWLPSASLTYGLTERMNIRMAYGRTLARPTIRELSPMFTYEFVKGFIYLGNPDLKRTLIDNLDFRWEWFTGPGEILAVSGFYKYFADPIEKAIVSDHFQIKYQNVDHAVVYGLELEARENLGFLGNLWRNFNVEGNFTWAKSEVKIPDYELRKRRDHDPNASDTRPLNGQSPYIVNLNLNYNNHGSGTDATLLYGVFGKRLSEVSEGGVPDVFEQPRPDLDFTLSQRIMGGLKFKLGIGNILDSKVKKTIEFKDVEYVVQEYSRGRSISMGLSYTL